MSYTLPLEHRRMVASRKAERYVSDPLVRLERINASRKVRGQPLLTVDQLPPLKRQSVLRGLTALERRRRALMDAVAATDQDIAAALRMLG